MPDPRETFAVTEAVLERRVIPARGKPYIHSCDQGIFEAVAHAIDDLSGQSFTLESLREATGAPFSQVAVALAFLKERGCVVPTLRRRSVAATASVHLDAMTEWHALREQAPAE